MAREDYVCPDGVTRTLDSQSEIAFIEFCDSVGIKILEYNTDKHRKFELCEKPQEWFRSKKLEDILYSQWFLYDVEKMRNMEHIMKSYDFHIEIDWVEFLAEIKGEFTNLNEMDHNERSFYTTWAMTKTLLATKYNMPLIVFISKTERKERVWRAEYYLPLSYKGKF